MWAFRASKGVPEVQDDITSATTACHRARPTSPPARGGEVLWLPAVSEQRDKVAPAVLAQILQMGLRTTVCLCFQRCMCLGVRFGTEEEARGIGEWGGSPRFLGGGGGSLVSC